MFGKNLELYRKANGFSQRALAGILNISNTSVSKFENGELYPNGEMLVNIARVLNIKTNDLMQSSNLDFNIEIPFFRKKSISSSKLDYLKKRISLDIQDYIFLDSLDKRASESFKYNKYVWNEYNDYEDSAIFVREQLGLTSDEPVYDLTYHLENSGFVILQSNYPEYFDGAVTYVDGYDNPFIVLNEMLSSDRHRFTLTHELGHHFLDFNQVNYTIKEQEKSINMFSSAFLLPKDDMLSIFGVHRSRISLNELGIVKKKYKTSLQSIVMRIHDIEVISKDYKSDLFRYFSSTGIRKKEPFSFEKEEPVRKKSLVYYLYLSDIISLNKASESLLISIEEIQESAIYT